MISCEAVKEVVARRAGYRQSLTLSKTRRHNSARLEDPEALKAQLERAASRGTRASLMWTGGRLAASKSIAAHDAAVDAGTDRVATDTERDE